MSLLKQLLISVSLAILVILSGALWVSVNSARSYLNTQLQSQADSAVTSLALTLSQPSNQDLVTQELIIMAQFDSGQFNRIVLRDPKGLILVDRVSDTDYTGDAPDWFSAIFPVIMAESGAQVTDGWKQVGQLYLQADASYARDSLWQSFMRLTAWVLGAGVIWALFVLFLIRWLRRVLRDNVTEELKALATPGGARSVVASKPAFTELTEVTEAIATARESILTTNEEQFAKIESLEVELNQDFVTGLVNRKYFVNELRRQLESSEEQSAGWLLLFRQRDLAEINRVMARANVDDWLQSLSAQLQELIAQYQGPGQLILARLNGSDFVVLAKEVGLTEASELIQAIQLVLHQQRIRLSSGDFCRWALAQTDYRQGQLLAHVMGHLDQALMRAESAGHSEVEVLTSQQADTLAEIPKGGETQWRTLIQEALLANRFSLEIKTTPYHAYSWHDATLLLQSSTGDDTTALSGYQFMPVATRLGLSAVCDLRAIALAMSWLEQNPTEQLHVRVSLASLTQPGFNDQLEELLANIPEQVVPRLAIELAAYAFTKDIAVVTLFAQLLRRYQIQLGIRHVLSLPTVLLDAKACHVSYIRVQTDDIHCMSQKEGGELMLRCLVEICLHLDITLVVQGGVDLLSSPTHKLLQEYGINTDGVII